MKVLRRFRMDDSGIISSFFDECLMCGVVWVNRRPLHGKTSVVGLGEVGLLVESLILLSLQLSLHPFLSLDLLLLDQ